VQAADLLSEPFEFRVGDHPTLEFATPAAFFLTFDASEPAIVADSEFRYEDSIAQVLQSPRSSHSPSSARATVAALETWEILHRDLAFSRQIGYPHPFSTSFFEVLVHGCARVSVARMRR
jgi:hypothetical protein